MKYPGGLLRHDRRSRVVNALTLWNEHLTSDNLHEKYCKMAVSPFVFYRGTAHLFWADFAGDWRMNLFGSARTRTWLQGDAHAENMGAFTNHAGELHYGLNDFDEAVLGDYQHDLWRFAVSLVLVAHRNGSLAGKTAGIIDAMSESYLDTMGEFAEGADAAEVTFTSENTSGSLLDFLKEVEDKSSRKKMLKKWTNKADDDELRFDLSRRDKLAPVSEWERGDILAAMPDYGESLSGGVEYDEEFFEVKDIARRLSAGTGSVGTPRYYVLIRGEDKSWKGHLILDVKRQGSPSGLGHLSAEEQIDYAHDHQHHAHRHAEAYKALAKHPDHFMGWLRLHDGFYSVRERSPFKGTFPTESLTGAKVFEEMAEVWARVLATDHQYAVRDLLVDGESYSIANEVVGLTEKGRGREDFKALVRDQAFEYASQVRTDYGYFMEAMQPNDCESVV